ncbi:MAG: glycosyl hydrolase family 18 protein, partial [Chloroflexota bacterium]|nr:glycosyl hydrolase family 18 protein [Chloroflexota bacterium]
GVTLPDGRVLSPPPAGVDVPSIHAEMLAEHGADVVHFEPGVRPSVDLPEQAQGGGPTSSAGDAIVLASWASPQTGDPAPAALANGFRREVHGYLPYWLLDPSLLQWMRYDRLTTIAYFSVGARTDGYLDRGTSSSPTAGWAGWTSSAMTDVINAAHTRGVRVILTVTMMNWDGGAGQATLLNNSTYRSRLVSQIVDAVRLRNADGVNLDFEPVEISERDVYTSFVRQLKASLVNAGVRSYLTVCTMAGAATWATGYDVAGLTASGAADHLFVMGYDYSWSGSARAGGVAPYESSYQLDVTDSVADYTRLTSPSKIIFGVPYYGRSWPTLSNELNAQTRTQTATSNSRAWYYTAGLEAAAAYGRRWDPNGLVPWFSTWDSANNTWREGYYDDATSLAYKYDLINSNNLAGTGMWTLLMDENRSELWDLLKTKFGDGTPPRVTDRTPAAAAVGVPTAGSLRVTFSEPVRGVSGSTFALRDTTNWAVVPATVTYDAATRTATLRPSSPLQGRQQYRAALTSAIVDGAGNVLPWTAWRFTTTSVAQTFSPARALTFKAGTHTGYRFDADGRVTGSKTYTLGASSSASTSQRAAVAGHSGRWFYVTNGVWAGYWLLESPSLYLPGIIGRADFSARTVSFAAGTYTGYRFNSSYTSVTASKKYTLTRSSTASATSRAVINGRAYLYIVNGVWGGYWVPESSSVHLD